MKESCYKRAILNIYVLLQLIPLSIAYSSENINLVFLTILFYLSCLPLVIIPIINIFEEVKVLLKTKISIISILLILLNILMFLFSAFYFGGRYQHIILSNKIVNIKINLHLKNSTPMSAILYAIFNPIVIFCTSNRKLLIFKTSFVQNVPILKVEQICNYLKNIISSTVQSLSANPSII